MKRHPDPPEGLVLIGFALFILSAGLPAVGWFFKQLREPNHTSLFSLSVHALLTVVLVFAGFIVLLTILAYVLEFVTRPRSILWIPVVLFAIVALPVYAVFFVLSGVVKSAMRHLSSAWPSVLAAAAALLVYAVTLGGSYVYDDVILHEDVRFTQMDRWSEFWTKPYWPDAVDQLYRPLTCMTFAVEYAVHGDRPWLYHLVNWLLHAGAAAAVAELARRLMGFRVACAAGVLFAVHPVHVEAVAGLVGRAELLCTLFSAVAMILFLSRMTHRRSIAIGACTVLAILSKEQGILLPAMLLAMVPFRRMIVAVSSGTAETAVIRERVEPAQLPLQISYRPSTSDKMNEERGAMAGLLAVLCIVTAGYLIFRENRFGLEWDRSALDWTANPLIRAAGADRILMPLVLVGRYLLLLLAPVKLSLDYGTHVIGWTVDWRQPYIYLGVATLAVWLIAMMWSLRRRQWAAMFCLLGLALSYGMVSNAAILIGTIFGERLMYLPSTFFLILATALLSRFVRPPWFTVVVIILMMVGSVRTFTYARLWNDPLKLYLADLQDHPLSMHLHSLCVGEYIARGDYSAARAMGEDSIRVLPDCWESYRMCVVADLKMHDFDDAERTLAHVDRRCPGRRIVDLQKQVRQALVRYQNGVRP